MKEVKLYRVFYNNGSKRQYCYQSCEDFVDNGFTDYEPESGKFTLRMANLLIKKSLLPLQKELTKYTKLV